MTIKTEPTESPPIQRESPVVPSAAPPASEVATNPQREKRKTTDTTSIVEAQQQPPRRSTRVRHRPVPLNVNPQLKTYEPLPTFVNYFTTAPIFSGQAPYHADLKSDTSPVIQGCCL